VQRGVGNWFSEVLVVQSSTESILKLSTTTVHTKFNSETGLDSNSFFLLRLLYEAARRPGIYISIPT
jgi:hypothetical protein